MYGMKPTNESRGGEVLAAAGRYQKSLCDRQVVAVSRLIGAPNTTNIDRVMPTGLCIPFDESQPKLALVSGTLTRDNGWLLMMLSVLTVAGTKLKRSRVYATTQSSVTDRLLASVQCSQHSWIGLAGTNR